MEKGIIIGGGIVGLTCGIVLRSKGIDAEIYECAESFEPISFEAMRTNTEKSKYFT